MTLPFLIPLAAVVTAQTIKVILITLKTGVFDSSYFLKHGRMPSSHTALVSSLATVIYWYEGVHSLLFAASLALAFIVIDDAIRFRFYLGQQAKTINRMTRELFPGKDKDYPRLHETLGHYPHEVIAGAIYGAAFSLLALSIF